MTGASPAAGSGTPAPAQPARRRTGLSVFAACIALSAWFGVLGLMFDLIGLPAETEQRLPLHSPVLGGIALGLVVAIPSTVLAWLAWHGAASTDQVALTTGILLAGWILVEYLVIQQLSLFQPAYLIVGVVLIWLGRSAMSRT